jgi:predicted alpha/beta superfamily hydrolase
MSCFHVAIATLLAVLASGCGQVDEAESSAASTRSAVRADVPELVQAVRPLELANTAVHELPAAGSGRHYEVWVDVPASYADGGDRRYPVVFVTDALYSFPLVRSIRNLLGQRGRNIEDFILVGLPPEIGLTSKASRSRDYTPSNPLLEPRDQRDSNYSATLYGEAAAYRDFIERQVFALVEREYRADMNRKVFAGHSFGGLFGSYVLLTKPAMFDAYILSSPSLWFHRHRIHALEQAYADAHADLRARARLYIGGYETRGVGPRYLRTMDMVGDARTFEERLASRGYRSLSISSEVIEGEDHLTVFPATISRGLLWALPGEGPYTGG